MEKIIKWEKFLESLDDQEIKGFLESAQKQVLQKEDNILQNFSHAIDINKVRGVLYRFLNNLVKKIHSDGVIAYQICADKDDVNQLCMKTYYASTPPEKKDSLPSILNFSVNFSNAGVVSYSISEKKVVYVKEIDPNLIVSETNKQFYKLLPIKSHIVIPLFLEQIPVGAIQFYSLYHSIEISDEDLFALEQNSHAIAITLKSILLYEQIYRNYIFLKKRNSQMKEELNLAKKIQKNLLPINMPKLEGATVEVWYKPMEMLGGDFFDFIIDREKRGFGIFISDVAGHGVPAALITMMIKSLLSTHRIYFNRPQSLLNKINLSLFDNNVSSFFVTAFYIFIDLHEKKIYFSSAGHNEMILYRKRKEYFHQLKPKGKFLGVFPEIDCEQQSMDIQSGDRIVLYTDGIIDIINAKGEELGYEGFKNLIHLTRNLDTVSTRNFLMENINRFENNQEFSDDKCFIVIDIH